MYNTYKTTWRPSVAVSLGFPRAGSTSMSLYYYTNKMLLPDWIII